MLPSRRGFARTPLARREQLPLLSPTNDPRARVPWACAREKCVSYELCRPGYTLVCQHSPYLLPSPPPPPPLSVLVHPPVLWSGVGFPAVHRRLCIVLTFITELLPNPRARHLRPRDLHLVVSPSNPFPRKPSLRLCSSSRSFDKEEGGLPKCDLLPSRYRLASWLRGFRGRSGADGRASWDGVSSGRLTKFPERSFDRLKSGCRYRAASSNSFQTICPRRVGKREEGRGWREDEGKVSLA